MDAELRRGLGPICKVACVIACVMVVTSLIAGCGVKIVYNNMDRIAVWVADDYLDLTRDQKRFLAARMTSFGYRHRRDELPRYAAGIRAFEAASADGLSYDGLAGFETQVEQWGRDVMLDVLGILGELLLSASAEQWDHVATEIQRSNEEILQRARDHDQAELRALWGDDYIDTIERFIGRTTTRQRDYIESLAVRYIPDEAIWVEYRERWQADFLALYALRDDTGAFQERLIEISIHFEDWQSDEYRMVTANNEALVRDATVGISQMLTERQHAKLSRRLLSIAEDLEELVEELPEQPPEDVCLVLCG